ncbi:MAG: RHS repeat-associated core domain-containing protein [Verrucomicrobia bacterium]|nr:RHS repeat-associated core domain-containing protein [Verrucomicrobiota bacterium]
MIVRRETNRFNELSGVYDLPAGQSGLPAATPACAGTADRDAAQAGGVGGLLGVDDTGQGFHFVAYDGNGNVMVLVDADDGTVSAEYEYGPFGELIRSTGPMSDNPIRFSTKYHDTETGLVYYGYRYYNPVLGRWLNRDPIGERGGVDVYVYVSNKSPNYIDWSGLCTVGCIRNAKCVVRVVPQGTPADIPDVLPQLVSLADDTEKFGLIYGAGTAAAASFSSASAAIAEGTRAAMESGMESGASDMAQRAADLFDEAGEHYGYQPYTRIEYQKCICRSGLGYLLTLGGTKWVDVPEKGEFGTWTKYEGSSDLDLGAFSDAKEAYEAGQKQCKKALREWKKNNKPCD